MTDETTTPSGAFDIRRLSPAEFGSLGMSQIAYVKPVLVNGAQAFAIHAADGTPMAVAPDFNVAMAAILQHELHGTMVQ